MGRKLLVCLLIVSALGLAAARGAPASERGLYGGRAQSLRNRSAAFADAAHLLTRVRLPAMSVPAQTVPQSHLHELEAASNHADAGATGMMSGTISSVIEYVQHHPPRGSRLWGASYDTTPTNVTSQSIIFGWPAIDDVLGDRRLEITASSAGQGRVKVFAQAESIWLSARPHDERFTASTRRIELRVTQPGHLTVTRAVTGVTTVRRVVALLNAIPIVQPVFYSCPFLGGSQSRTFTYQLLGTSGQTLARIGYSIPARSIPGPCAAISVTIGHRPQDPLLGGPQMVTVQRIFGIPYG